GAKQVKENFDGGVFIFLAPPSLKALEERIRSRGTEEESVVQSRLEEARKELKQIHLYDYMVINKSVNQATVDIQSIMTSEHLRRDRMEKEYRSEEHTSELQSRFDLVCRLLLEKKLR